MNEWAKENGIKYCPSCKTKVEKVDGCEHLICPFCRYEWCWVCGEKFYTGHMCDAQAQAVQIEINNLRILGMLFGPVVFVFIGLIGCVYYVYKVTNNEFMKFLTLESKISEHKKLSYFLAVVIGLTLNPLIILILMFLCSVDFTNLLLKNHAERKKLRNVLSVLLFPFLTVAMICFYILCPFIAVIILLKRLYTALRVWKNPRYLPSVNKYGYY